MDVSVMTEAKGKAAIIAQVHQHGHSSSVTVPTSTPTCVIIKSFRAPVERTIGTVKLKTQLDTSFPIFLRGKCSEEQFTHTVQGINWFANLLHEAEIEYYAQLYSTASAWKEVHAALVLRDFREDKLVAYCKDHGLEYKARRNRVASEEDLKSFQHKVIAALHSFIDDENARTYLSHGIQWNYPEKNQWRWLEIHVLPDGSQVPEIPAPKHDVPISPHFGDQLKFTVEDSIDINGHTEYVIKVTTNLKEWYPIVDTYVLHRFNDFKEFYNELNEFMEEKSVEIGMPCVPDGSFIGRKSKSTVLKRKALFQDLLDAIASSKELQNCQPVLEFFDVRPDIDSWKYSQYLV